ncbi:MAG: NAD-dependent epimerase/dehydratase family protein [Halieaceae bacterium]|jgi:dihydroflavonol-4-reductase|nr:NAD-dependent epimerase/dehydratase family protein [Halieaceae bacterium]
MAKVLVMGASGFLGSHVVKELVAAGRDVRVMVRASSDTRAIDHLPLERVVGGPGDSDAVAAAMSGCDSVFYCIVDTRAWLRDPAPLYATNVDGLRAVLDVAVTLPLKHFVFTSTYATIGLNASGISTELDTFNWWDRAPDYVKCRVQAEDMFLEYCRDRGLPGVACCVGNTYGADDVAPTPHGNVVKDVALGRMPYYWDGGGPCVGVRDAARALLLAETRGRVGERYIVAERWLDYEELFALAASRAGISPPRKRIPLPVLYAMAAMADLASVFTRRDNRFSIASLRCSTLLPDVDSAKARRELDWQPRPIEQSVAEAVDYYLANP